MFTRYFVELTVPPAAVEAALVDTSAEWLNSLARDADDHGSNLLIDVGAGHTPTRVDKRVTVELGTPARLPSRLIVPLRWVATGPAALFPRLDADLEVGGLGPALTQLSISASYEPPLGPIGQVLDRLLLHRLAEATVKDFMDRLGESIQQRVLDGRGGDRRTP